MGDQSLPWGFRWRSKRLFVITTVGFGLSTDLFLYGIVIPVLPFMLRDRVSVPEYQIQEHTSQLLAMYAGASVLFSVPAGWIADKLGSRQIPFLIGLGILLAATTLMGFGETMPVLSIARLLQGMSAAVVWSTGLAMVQDQVGPAELGQIIGTLLSVTAVGGLAAPVLGGMLYDRGGMIAVFGLATTVLAVDLVMRLLVIDKQQSTKYFSSNQDAVDETDHQTPTQAAESNALLPKADDAKYKIPEGAGKLSRSAPLVYCLHNPRLFVALLLSFIQGLIIGVFDATVATEAEKLFGFSSQQVGLLFLNLTLPYLALASPAGWAVDRFGTKIVSTAGYGLLCPGLALLAVPSLRFLTGPRNIALFCVVLFQNGVGCAVIASPSFVEASNVIQKYEAANPRFFGEHGPYAQLFGLNSVFFFSGLTVGPLIGGMLRDQFGYPIMAYFFGGVAGATAILSFLRIGE